MKKNFVLNIIINISIGLIGLWVLFNPSIGLDFFRYYLGIILVIGSFTLFYLYKKRINQSMHYLIQSIILFVFGAFFIFSDNFSLLTLAFILIAWMLIEAILNINAAIAYKKLNINAWYIFLIYSIITIIGAIIIFYNINLSAMILIQVTAAFTVVRSIIYLIDLLFFKKQLNKNTDVVIK